MNCPAADMRTALPSTAEADSDIPAGEHDTQGRDQTTPLGSPERTICRGEPERTICRGELEAEDGWLNLRRRLPADGGREWSADGNGGLIPDNVGFGQRGHHDKPQTSWCRRKRRSPRVIAIDMCVRRHERRTVVVRTTQEIREITNGKRCQKRHQDLGNQPQRAKSFKASKHMPIASTSTYSK
jgi:hypothetical protein